MSRPSTSPKGEGVCCRTAANEPSAHFEGATAAIDRWGLHTHQVPLVLLLPCLLPPWLSRRLFRLDSRLDSRLRLLAPPRLFLPRLFLPRLLLPFARP